MTTLKELIADARRYRFLRERDVGTINNGGIFAGMTPDNIVLNGEDLDQEIDAVMGERDCATLTALAEDMSRVTLATSRLFRFLDQSTWAGPITDKPKEEARYLSDLREAIGLLDKHLGKVEP